MQKILSVTILAFCTAALLSSSYIQPAPQLLTPDCYESCFTGDIMNQFKAEAGTAAFAAMHEAPIDFTFANPNGESVSFDTKDGKKAAGYFIKSSQKTKNWLFVIQEWWGLNDHIKREAEILAKELGNVNVLAIDMYDGKIAATPDSAMKLMKGASTERLENIVNGAIHFSGTDAKIFTIGWCFGGMWSLQTSLMAGKQAAGCVMYYGRPENNIEKLKLLNCEVIGFFGNKDKSPSPEIVNQFEADMISAGKKITTHKYEAGHGFANPSNPSFNKEATEDAHQKTVAFLKSKM